MHTLKARYDGRVFIPEQSCGIRGGSEVIITIQAVNGGPSERRKKLAAFRKLTEEVAALHKTDPLPAEFDTILSRRVAFREFAGL